MARVAGVCVLKDAIDIVPAICGHYLGLGFERLLFLDDGSTDGTFELLERLARRDRRVIVERARMDPLAQGALMTAACNRLVAEGYGPIFPFDSDEFWRLDMARVVRFADRHETCVFRGRFVQFVQARSVRRSTPLDLLKAVNRAPARYHTAREAVRQLNTYVAFAKPKVAFKARGPVQVSDGQHEVTLADVEEPPVAEDLEVFHLILRSAEQIEIRAERAWNYYWKKARSPKHLRLMWGANSANRLGFMDPPQREEIMLISDTRLRDAGLRALAYFALRHPLLFARAWAISARPRAERRWGGPWAPEGWTAPLAGAPARLLAGLGLVLAGGAIGLADLAPFTEIDEWLAGGVAVFGAAASALNARAAFRAG